MSYDSSYGNQDSGYGGDQGQGGFQDPNAQGGFDPNAQGGGFDQGQGGYQDPNAQGGGFGSDPSVDPNAGYGGDSSNVADTGEKKHHYVKDGLEAAAVGGVGYEAYKHHEDKDNPQQPEKKSWF